MAKKQLVDAYFRFLNLAQAVQALPSVPKLDAAEDACLKRSRLPGTRGAR